MGNLAWSESIEWSKTAGAVQSQYQKSRKIALMLAGAGAVFAAISSNLASIPELGGVQVFGYELAPDQVFAFGSALAVASASFIGRHLISGDDERNWIMARAAAEALKSHAYRFASGVEPYQDDRTAAKELANKILNIKERNKSIPRVLVTTEEIEKKPGPERKLPISEYMTTRVDDQINWYRKRANEHNQEKSKYQLWTWVLSGTGTVLGLLGGYGLSFVAAWIAAITTISGAVLAYVAASRFEFLVQTYFSTSDRLRHAKSLYEAGALTKEDFVLKSEEIMSSENSAWVAEYRSEDVAPQPAPGGADEPLEARGQDNPGL